MAARLSVCLSFDFDSMSVWLGSDNATAVSRGEFGAVAVPRILSLLERYDAPATFFVPGFTALAYPDLVRRIRDAGHELGHHGVHHESPSRLSEEDERAVLERGVEILREVAGVTPRGWRAPAWKPSASSLRLLVEAGFLYDSSLMSGDFLAYYARVDDRWSRAEGLTFGRPSPLVELPVYWGLDDFPYFEYLPPNGGGLKAPSEVLAVWEGDFDYAYQHCPGGVFTLTMHPQVIGRGHRLLMLERFVERARALDDVVFVRMGDYAAAWAAANPAASNPPHPAAAP
ncbi:MAG: polysaccharide deacetylase family protein [Acidimicrobiales bacterium]